MKPLAKGPKDRQDELLLIAKVALENDEHFVQGELYVQHPVDGWIGGFDPPEVTLRELDLEDVVQHRQVVLKTT